MGLRIKLTDFDNYQRHHDAGEVEDIFIFQGKTQKPSEKGLLSPEVFGDTTQEKRSQMGQINLDGKYLHPLIYRRVFKRSYRKIDKILAGEGEFIITDEGEIREAKEDEDGNNGIDWFYENFNDLDIENLRVKDDDSTILKQVKASIHELDRDDLFVDKWLVIPLMFRDVNTQGDGHISLDILNEKYKKLLSMVKIVQDNDDNPMFHRDNIKFRIQLQLVEIYNFLRDKTLKGKNSVLKNKVMSKNVDYTSRLVMSAPDFDSEKFGESPVNLDRAGIPLTSVADSFAPFIINNMQQILRSKFDKGEIDCDLDLFEEKFSNENLHEMINTYVDSWGERFDQILVPESEEPITMTGEKQSDDEEWEEFERPMTITDLIYQAAFLAVEVKDRHNIMSRYPIQDMFNIVPKKVHVLSTKDTHHIKMGGFEYKHYPVVGKVVNDPELTNDPEKFQREISTLFDETANVSNLDLEGMNGDYDGQALNALPYSIAI